MVWGQPLARSAARTPKIHRVERRGAQRPCSQGRAHLARCGIRCGASRRSIPSIFVEGGRRKAGAPAPLKNRGDGARLLFEN